MADHEQITVQPAELMDAATVHRQIPEFVPEYIGDNYREKDIESKNPYVIVGKVGGVAVGYMIGYDKPDSMHIWLTGTLPMYRRHGVFDAMLQDLVQQAAERGHHQITVKTYEEFAPMLGALAKAGFERVETAEAEEDGIRLAKTLE